VRAGDLLVRVGEEIGVVRGRGRGRWTPAEARSVLEAWRRSGLPLARFARHRGYGVQRLRWWKGKLAKQAAGARFVPVELAPAIRGAVSMSAPGRIEIVLADGLQVRASERVDPRAIARLIAALREASC
jgi:hypothetical protein